MFKTTWPGISWSFNSPGGLQKEFTQDLRLGSPNKPNFKTKTFPEVFGLLYIAIDHQSRRAF